MSTTKTLTFRGASDDCVLCDDPTGKNSDVDEVYAFEDDGHVGTFDVVCPSGGVCKVHAVYDGCWSFAVGCYDDDVPIPEWPIHVSSAGYTAKLMLTVPEDTRVTWRKP